MEDWRQVFGFSNYEVSSIGRVRSKPRAKTRGGIVRQDVNTNGRYKVDLYDDTHKRKTIQVHRLVATHFLPNLNGYSQVDHVNGDYLDNRVVNLRWCTDRQNKYNTGLRKDNTTGVKGVAFDKSRGKWKVQVQSSVGKLAVSKRFKTKEEAVAFRNKMVQVHYDPKFYRDS